MTTNGRVALVTGAGSGIGRAAALLKEGYRVVLTIMATKMPCVGRG